MSFMNFELLATDGKARRGRLTFPRGVVETPAFMPVGTYGTVKGMLPRDIEDIGAQIILGNTFHLWLRPGTEVIQRHGDLHDFMQWKGPILTDSGGFQVFSLGAMRKIKEEGVTFASPVDGAKVFMGPEESMAVQRALGSDIVMIFDECTPYPADHDVAKRSMELSLRWAKRSKIAHGDSPSALFGIVQGGMHEDLRLRSLDGLQEIGFDGLAIGGLSVGEPKEEHDPRARFPAAADAGRQAALPDGRGQAGRPGGRRAPRRGHVRLRDADAQCAQRPPVRRQRGDQDPQLGTQARRLHARPDLRLLHLQTFFPRLSAPLGQVRGNAR